MSDNNGNQFKDNSKNTYKEQERPPLPKANIIARREELFNLSGGKKDKIN
jgi:hypothetical protein